MGEINQDKNVEKIIIMKRPTKDLRDYKYIITDKGRSAANTETDLDIIQFLLEITDETDIGLFWEPKWSLLRTSGDSLGISVEELIDRALENNYIRLFCSTRYDYYNDNDKQKYFTGFIDTEQEYALAIRANSKEDAIEKVHIWIRKNWEIFIKATIRNLPRKPTAKGINLVYNYFIDNDGLSIEETSQENFNKAIIEMDERGVFYGLEDDKELGIFLPLRMITESLQLY